MNITFTVVGAFLRVSHQTNDNFDMNFCFFFENKNQGSTPSQGNAS